MPPTPFLGGQPRSLQRREIARRLMSAFSVVTCYQGQRHGSTPAATSHMVPRARRDSTVPGVHPAPAIWAVSMSPKVKDQHSGSGRDAHQRLTTSSWLSRLVCSRLICSLCLSSLCVIPSCGHGGSLTCQAPGGAAHAARAIWNELRPRASSLLAQLAVVSAGKQSCTTSPANAREPVNALGIQASQCSRSTGCSGTRLFQTYGDKSIGPTRPTHPAQNNA
jgi:hypothetical protein